MKTTKIFIAIVGIFSIAMTGCQAKTSSNAPDSTTGAIESPSGEATKTNKDDATSQVRRDQLNSDIRAREQRSGGANTNQASNRPNNDLASEVRSKLEANLPASALTVTAKDGAVMVTGTVPTKAQYDRISMLAKEITGVKTVMMKVAVAPAKK